MTPSRRTVFHSVQLASGAHLNYRLVGDASRPPAVLLNGLLSDTTFWAGVIPRLARHFRILTFDFRGQGRSDAPEGPPYRVEQQAQDAWELMEKLGVSRPWLLGLSNGSSVAVELLAAHPYAFRGAVLTSALPRIDFATRLRIEHWCQCLERGGPLMQFDAAAPFLWGDRFLEARHALLRAFHLGIAEQPQPEAYRGALLQMRGVLDWDGRERLASIRAPVLVLVGEEDLLSPPWKCRATAEGISGARFRVVPGIGHAYPVEDPKGYSESVLRFVDEVSKPQESHGQPGIPVPY